ncbi:tetratricopeptide repeat protein [Candidatus Sumerlaeota bacterium]|nr:tetratricopeptide repeat protein [Candidatus Sumerlaeota bacterium]
MEDSPRRDEERAEVRCPPPRVRFERYAALGAGAVIVLAAIAAYHNSLSVPFVFDDRWSIVDNPSIRDLWTTEVLSPPRLSATIGRPLVNVSLAANFALGGMRVWGYHVFNLAVHVCAGLALFGLVRRTLLRPGTPARFSNAATRLAFLAALLWVVHPLQTESVTCVIQRAESMVGLFYLLTLYCFVRSAESPRRGLWQTLAVLACLLGMASKELMVSAPLIVLLYDRTFVAGSFREAWARRRRFYLCLAATWIPLACLVVGMGGTRNRAAGFGTGVAWWQYALTQCKAIVLYLRLCFWPHPLIVDYGNDLVKNPAVVAPDMAALVALIAATLVALVRRPAWGFVGAWFFVILAPSSSVVPLATQTIAEHRMYLPVASVVVSVVLYAQVLLGRRSWIVVLIVATILGALTIRRNDDYRTEIAIWCDTLAKRPDNARAHSNLGGALIRAHCFQEAIEAFREALRLDPEYYPARHGWGVALQRMGRTPAAAEQFEAALRLRRVTGQAHAQILVDLGIALAEMGGLEEGVRRFEESLRIDPKSDSARNNLGVVLVRLGRLREAEAQIAEALRLNPDNPEAQANLDRIRRLLAETGE